jgi:hypothetical protein
MIALTVVDIDWMKCELSGNDTDCNDDYSVVNLADVPVVDLLE